MIFGKYNIIVQHKQWNMFDAKVLFDQTTHVSFKIKGTISHESTVSLAMKPITDDPSSVNLNEQQHPFIFIVSKLNKMFEGTKWS